MNKNFNNKLIENFYDRDLTRIKEELDKYYTLCLRFNDLALEISKAGFNYNKQNDIFDIVELFVAHHLKEYGINTDLIVDKITEENN